MKTIKLYPVLFFLFAALADCKAQEAQGLAESRKIAFNSAWQFHLNDSIEDTINQNTEWRELDLPHDWSIEGEFNPENPSGVGGGALPGGLGWYKKTFKIEAEDSTQLTSIVFDGIYQDSEVWINGQQLGNRPYGYICFEYNLTPYLNYGEEENEILVKVDNSSQPNSRWYSGSGIYRNVWLKTTDKLHIPQWGTFITTPQVTSESASVEVEISLKNAYAEAKTATIQTSFLNGENEVASVSEEINIAASSEEKIHQKVVIENPGLWSVENPQLYTAVTKILVDGEVLDRYETSFGIRSFKFDVKEGFILNGNQVKIKGVCMHHDLGPLGAAINTRAIERQLEILQEMGVNGIRTAHNPPAPELLDLCDRMGFIVMDEAFDMWAQHKTENDYAQNWEQWHEKDLTDLIVRDRNHPSIFMWSIGNEIPEQWSEKGAKIGWELAKIVKELDSTRPVIAAMNPPIAINSNEDISIQFEENRAQPNALAGSGALDIIGYNYAHETYPYHLKNFPNTPFIATETTSALETRGYYEFPSDTTKIWPVSWDKVFEGGNPDNTVSAFDQVRAPWGSLHEATWKVIKKYDFLSGFYIWTGFDYIGEPTPYIWPSRSSYFGIVDLAGFPKDVYYMYKSAWTTEDVLHILPHWNWQKGRAVDVWAYYNNADEVELFLNGKSMGTKSKEGDDLHVMWRFPFEPGTLKAISRKDGNVVKETEVKTAGEPLKLELSADRSTIKADNNDLSFITVTITDEEGTLAPRAGNLIKFSLEGDGKIVGVASGDPTNHESFKGTEHSAMNGKALVIVQSGKEAGNLILTATSEGLQKASITITAN
ncbi:beta-galactosidase GalB [Zunongwangia sp. H14]|uniref:beta-galactosidase GalB n=1 Tax=Zunongwangia sp. H14 TaxID=3240792 RepID=UPI003566921A